MAPSYWHQRRARMYTHKFLKTLPKVPGETPGSLIQRAIYTIAAKMTLHDIGIRNGLTEKYVLEGILGGAASQGAIDKEIWGNKLGYNANIQQMHDHLIFELMVKHNKTVFQAKKIAEEFEERFNSNQSIVFEALKKLESQK